MHHFSLKLLTIQYPELAAVVQLVYLNSIIPYLSLHILPEYLQFRAVPEDVGKFSCHTTTPPTQGGTAIIITSYY